MGNVIFVAKAENYKKRSLRGCVAPVAIPL